MDERLRELLFGAVVALVPQARGSDWRAVGRLVRTGGQYVVEWNRAELVRFDAGDVLSIGGQVIQLNGGGK